MRLKTCIVTVPRPHGAVYVHDTIASLSETGFFSDPERLPLVVSVGALDSSYLDRYRGLKDIVVDTMTEEEAMKSGFVRLNLRQKSTFGHVRAMRLIERYHDNLDAALILEDDAKFAKGWIPYLWPLLEAMKKTHGEYWMLSLYRSTQEIHHAFAKKERLTPIPLHAFFGAVGLIHSKGILKRLADYLTAHCLEKYENVNDFGTGDFVKANKIPAMATVPCLIEHMGKHTTGQTDPGRFPQADLFFPSVQHLL